MYSKEVTVAQWGNAKAVRIPSAILNMLSLDVGDKLDMKVESGKLVIEPVKKEMTIYDFLKDGKSVIESEYWTDGPVGREFI